MEVFNRTRALDRLGGDAERLDELLDDFQMKIEPMIKAMEKAREKGRAPRLSELATELHRLSDAISAEGMVDLASQMQDAAKAEDFEKAATLLIHMGMELDWLLRILDENRCSGNL